MAYDLADGMNEFQTAIDTKLEAAEKRKEEILEGIKELLEKHKEATKE